MPNVTFDYALPNNVTLTVNVKITPGYPARVDCLPEDAYPAEDDTVDEIVDSYIATEYGPVEFWCDDLFIVRHKKMISVVEDIKETAIEKLRDGE